MYMFMNLYIRMHSHVLIQSLVTMQEQMEKLWCERIPMCIEVKGQAAASLSDSSVLLEQWLIQALPRRYCTVYCTCVLHNTCIHTYVHVPACVWYCVCVYCVCVCVCVCVCACVCVCVYSCAADVLSASVSSFRVHTVHV